LHAKARKVPATCDLPAALLPRAKFVSAEQRARQVGAAQPLAV
jgi:hypothetical protein